MRLTLIRACAIACLAAATAGYAQGLKPARMSFDIETQPLKSALNAFSRQSGLQVMRRDEDVRTDGLTAPKVIGQLSVEEALTQLLVNSGLKFEFVNDKAVAIKSVEPASSREDKAVGDEATQRMQVAEAGTDRASAATVAAATEEDAGIEKLDEVVVTAQKRRERLKDVPISISVLSGATLDSSTAEGMTELLNRVPGVATTLGAQGGSTQVAVRGVTAGDAIFSGSSPVAYYLDSVPFGLVKSAIAPDMNSYDLDRVEVLRGPQGTLYGASALNGVVRVLTKDADPNAFDFKARTSLSSTDDRGSENYRGDLAVNVPLIEGKLAVRAVAGYENLSGWIDGPSSGREGVNDAQLRNYRLKVNARPTDQLSIGLSGWHSNSDYGGKSTSSDDGTITAARPEPIAIDFDAYGLKVGYEFPAFSVSSQTSYLDYSNDSLLDVSPLGFDAIFVTDFKSKVFAEEVLLNSPANGSWQWSAGAFYRRGEDLLFQTYPAEPGVFYVDYTDRSESFAVFGEVGRRFYDDRLKWTLGLRYFEDDVLNKENSSDPNFPVRPLVRNSSSFDSTTPRAVLTWYPHDDLTVYGSYSEGFRSGFPQNANILQKAPSFPALRPDKLRNYEVGAKGSLLGGRVNYDTAVYFIDWQDIQQTLELPFNGVQVSAPTNGESASGFGVDLGLATELVKGLELAINFSWNDLTLDASTVSSGGVLFEAGDRPNLSPEYTAGASLQYGLPLGASGFKARFAASANYVSEQITRTIDTSFNPPRRFEGIGDSMLIARTSLSLDAPSHWTATLFVDNVNNERGTPVIAVVSVPELSARVRPRTIGLQFEYRFTQ